MRFNATCVLAVAMLIGLVAGALTTSSALAQDATPATMAEHSLVGVWLLDTDAMDPANAPEVTVFTDDGAYISVDAEGATTLGAWEGTGPETATLTLVSTGSDEAGGFAGTFMVRATITVDASGETFTAEYTGEFIDPEGASEGEFGPGTAMATRIAVEPMGSPAGPLSVLFEEGAATPTP
jgi:hypothetical protein